MVYQARAAFEGGIFQANDLRKRWQMKGPSFLRAQVRLKNGERFATHFCLAFAANFKLYRGTGEGYNKSKFQLIISAWVNCQNTQSFSRNKLPSTAKFSGGRISMKYLLGKKEIQPNRSTRFVHPQIVSNGFFSGRSACTTWNQIWFIFVNLCRLHENNVIGNELRPNDRKNVKQTYRRDSWNIHSVCTPVWHHWHWHCSSATFEQLIWITFPTRCPFNGPADNSHVKYAIVSNLFHSSSPQLSLHFVVHCLVT